MQSALRPLADTRTQRMRHGGKRLSHRLVAELDAVALERAKQIMLGGEVLDLILHRLRQIFVNSARIDVFGVGALGRRDVRQQQGPLGRQRVEGTVRMKSLEVRRVRPGSDRRLDLAIGVEIADVVELGRDALVSRRRQLERPERATEADVIFVLQARVANHADGVSGHRVLDRLNGLGSDRR